MLLCYHPIIFTTDSHPHQFFGWYVSKKERTPPTLPRLVLEPPARDVRPRARIEAKGGQKTTRKKIQSREGTARIPCIHFLHTDLAAPARGRALPPAQGRRLICCGQYNCPTDASIPALILGPHRQAPSSTVTNQCIDDDKYQTCHGYGHRETTGHLWLLGQFNSTPTQPILPLSPCLNSTCLGQVDRPNPSVAYCPFQTPTIPAEN